MATELTELEKSVLKLLGQGDTNKEIQAKLMIPVAKLRKIKKESVVKLGARNSIHAVVLAVSQKLID